MATPITNKPGEKLFDKIILACRQDKELRRLKKIQLIVVLSSILLIALLVLVFSMGVLVGQNQEDPTIIFAEM